MKSFKDQIRNLKNSLFGNKQEASGTKTESPEKTKSHENITSISSKLSRRRERAPHYIQIGFDFGTAFSKCVYRDVNANEVWIYIPERISEKKIPFLYPSILKMNDGTLSYADDTTIHYLNDGIYHLKWALKEVASGQWQTDILNSYRQVIGNVDNKQLADIVKSCAVYYLAGTFGEIRKSVKKHFKDFGEHPNDYMAINIGIPVAFASDKKVLSIFSNILCDSWGLADDLAAYPQMKHEEIKSLCAEKKFYMDSTVQEACLIVPEVSANLQGFVKSRVSMPGLYLFSDTGAATVDQCIFTFTRRDYEESLNYFHAEVLPLGSSHLEYIAACQELSCLEPLRDNLEKWRKRKENGRQFPEMKHARQKISKNLSSKTQRNLSISRKKLFIPSQLEDVKIIFGGGGHCEDPYKKAVLNPFLRPVIFSKSFRPSIVGIPKPKDLNLDEKSDGHWMSRLSVAYGLSFAKYDLVDNLFPSEIDNPQPHEVWKPTAEKRRAPTKDEC